ncbi:MAG: alpha/beta fold hydrolase [Candidatus Bathyarchaeota archaeon]|nr:alpha/beta fold hydrolase [Candidatus Bathyarchaeota archaeon]
MLKLIKPIVFRNERQCLVGILHVPDDIAYRGKAPGIVMFHGFTGNKIEAHRLFVHVARSLCDSGFIVFRFDFRGSGDSDGDFEDMTLPGEVSDGRRALSLFMRYRYLDRSRVGVLGLSMGGRVAAILASMDARIRFAILYSPALGPLRGRMLSWMPREQIDRLDLGEAVEVSPGWYLKKRFFETVDYIVPSDVMREIKAPILIVHGDRDQVIPVEEVRRYFDSVRDLDSRNELYIVRGGDHTFSKREHTREVINKTLEWLRKVI